MNEIERVTNLFSDAIQQSLVESRVGGVSPLGDSAETWFFVVTLADGRKFKVICKPD